MTKPVTIPDNIANKYMDLSTHVLQSDDLRMSQDQVARLVGLMWKFLSPERRRAFMDAIDENLQLNFTRRKKERDLHELAVMEIIEGWPSVLSGVAVTDKGFALSIMKSRKDPDWWPSDNQLVKMKKLWRDRIVDIEQKKTPAAGEDDGS